jgi:hypothetical protein
MSEPIWQIPHFHQRDPVRKGPRAPERLANSKVCSSFQHRCEPNIFEGSQCSRTHC